MGVQIEGTRRMVKKAHFEPCWAVILNKAHICPGTAAGNEEKASAAVEGDVDLPQSEIYETAQEASLGDDACEERLQDQLHAVLEDPNRQMENPQNDSPSASQHQCAADLPAADNAKSENSNAQSCSMDDVTHANANEDKIQGKLLCRPFMSIWNF